MSIVAGRRTGVRFDPAFEGFVADHSAGLLRTAYLLTHDRGHAEDLLQTTLLRMAWRWSTMKERPEAYAWRVLINLSRDRWRRLSRRVREQSEADLGPLAGRMDDPADRVVARHTVLLAVRQLPARQREVVALRFFDDLSVAETAVALSCTEGTVKSHTSRALSRLRELLADPRQTDPQQADQRQTEVSNVH